MAVITRWCGKPIDESMSKTEFIEIIEWCAGRIRQLEVSQRSVHDHVDWGGYLLSRPKETATEINMRMRAAMERMPFASHCPECGVSPGSKHFLHCRR